MFASSLLVEKLNTAFRLCSFSNTDTIKQGQKILSELRNNQQYPFIVIAYMTDQFNNKDNKLRASVQLRIWVDEHPQQDTDTLLNTLLPAYFICEQFLVKQMRSIIFRLPCDKAILKKIFSYDNGSYLNKIRVLKLTRKILKEGDFESYEDPNFFKFFIKTITEQLEFEDDYQLPIEIQYELLTLLLIIKDYHYESDEGDEELLHNNFKRWMKIIKKIINSDIKETKNPVLIKLKIKSFQLLISIMVEIETFFKEIEDFMNEIFIICKTYKQLKKYCLSFFLELIIQRNGQHFIDQSNHKNQLLYKIIEIIIENIYNPQEILDRTKNYQDFIDYYYQNNDRDTPKGISRLILKQFMKAFTDLWLDIINTGIENPFKGNQNNSLLTFLCESHLKYDHKSGIVNHMIPHTCIQKVYNSIIRQNFMTLYEKIFDPKGQELNEQQIVQFLCQIRFVLFFRKQIQSNEILLTAKLCSKMAIKYPVVSTICYYFIKYIIIIKEQIKGPYYFTQKNQFYSFFTELLQDLVTHSFHLTLSDLEIVSNAIQVCYNNQKDIFMANQHALKKVVIIILQLSLSGQKYEILENVLKIGQLYVKFIRFQPEFQQWIKKLVKNKIINRSVLQMYSLYLTQHHTDMKTIENIYEEMSDTQYWVKNKNHLDFSIPFYALIISKFNKNSQCFDNVYQKLFDILASLLMEGNNTKDFELILNQVLLHIHHILQGQQYDLLYELLLNKITNKSSKILLKSLLRITQYFTSNKISIKQKIIELIIKYKHQIKTAEDITFCINLIFPLFQNYFIVNNHINWQSWGNILSTIIKNLGKANLQKFAKNFVDSFNEFNNYYNPNISEIINQKMQIALTKLIMNEKSSSQQK